MIGCFLGIRVAGECEGCWLEIDLEGTGRDIGRGDREEDIILFGVGGGGALGPGH